MNEKLITQILLDLASGQVKKIKFKSKPDIEAFRQLIYKTKKEFDYGMYAAMDDYIIQSLKFEKLPDNVIALSFFIKTKRTIEFDMLSDEPTDK